MISVGQQIGGYTIQRRIGGGGMGDVFLAQHRRVARRAAIKALIPELSAKEAVLEHFFKEARNTSLIRHPGMVEILDCDLHDGQAFIIMEFLEGESLGTYLKRNGPLEPDMAFLLGMGAAVAGAVAAAHVAGIMHRDLKPENVYLHLPAPTDPTVAVKVLDFGIAKLSRDDGGPSKTESGVMLGSPTYMSPEQCRGVGRPDARSDIYSLGCVLYETLCGQPPFPAKGVGELIVAHLTEPPRAPVKLVPDVPPKLNSLLLKMLAKSADDRPQSMNQVIETLRDCARALGIDFGGALQPLTPVERPVHMFVAPTPPVAVPMAPATAPASRFVAAPAPAPAPSPVARPDPSTLPMPVPVAALSPNAKSSAPAAGATPASASPPTGHAGAYPVGGTLILGVPVPAAAPAARRDLPIAQASTALPAPLPEIAARPGGTMILDMPAPAPPRSGAATPGGGGAPHPFAGGTMILDTSHDLPPRATDDAPDDDGDSDSSGHDRDDGGRVHRDADDNATAPATDRTSRVGDRRRGRRQVPIRAIETTQRTHPPADRAWYAVIWQDRPRLMLVVGAVVVLVGVVLSALLASTRSPTADATDPAPPAATVEPPSGALADPASPAVVPTEVVPPPLAPATAPPSLATATTPTAAPSESVRIEIQGVPSGTRVTIDGQPVSLPLRVPRGPATHRIAVRPPGGTERSIVVDGNRDRVIELVVDPPAPPPPAHQATRALPPSPPDSSHTKPPAAPAAPRDPTAAAAAKKKPGAVAKDREAITDL